MVQPIGGRDGYSPSLHERDRDFQVISGYPALSQAIHNWTNQSLPLLREIRPETLKKYKLRNRDYILVNPTVSRREKAWDSQNFKILVQNLKSFTALDIKIIGAPNKTDWLKEVTSD